MSHKVCLHMSMMMSSDSLVNSASLCHTEADTLGQTVDKHNEIQSRNLQKTLTSKWDWDTQSETSVSSVNTQQAVTNAGILNFLPTDSICGRIEINDSSGNHIGTKIVASTLTVVNNNTSAINPLENENQRTTVQTTSIIRKTSCCSKLIILLSIIMTGLMVMKLYEFNMSSDTKRQILHTSDVTELPILTTTVRPKLPDPWIVTRAQWDAAIPQTTCYGYATQAVSVAIGDTKSNTCKSITSCSKIIREIQSNKMMNLNKSKCDIDYNFLIGNDSRIYEGLAWNATKLYDFQIVVKIAFIGDYSSKGKNDVLTDTQVFSLLKFLEKSENEKRFRLSYTITPECCSDAVKSPGDNILISMISWNISRLAFRCIIHDEYRCCKHLYDYYHKYSLDTYKYNNKQ